jgi:hypothetical protein
VTPLQATVLIVAFGLAIGTIFFVLFYVFFVVADRRRRK